MFVYTFILGFQWTFKNFFINNRYILVIKFEKLNLRKSLVSQFKKKKKRNSQYSLAFNKPPRFLFSYARSTILNEKIKDMGTGQPFSSFKDFQAIFTPSNKFDRKKSLSAPGMKVPNDIKIHQQARCLATRDACYIKGQGVSFGESLIIIRGFISHKKAKTVFCLKESFLVCFVKRYFV